MKIKITEPGWEGYTGPFGSVMFEDGVSVGDVSQHDIDRVAATVHITSLDGDQVGPAQHIINIAGLNADLAALNEQSAPAETADQASAPGVRIYTEAELGEVADKEGIVGIRKIAAPHNLKSTSIKALITLILIAQGKIAKVETLASELVSKLEEAEQPKVETAPAAPAAPEAAPSPEAPKLADPAPVDPVAAPQPEEPKSTDQAPAPAPVEQAPEAPKAETPEQGA